MTLTRCKTSLIRPALVALTTSLVFSIAASEKLSASDDPAPGALSHWQQSAPTGRLIVKYRSAEKTGQSPRGSKKFNRKILRDNHKMELSRQLSETSELLVARNFESNDGDLKQPGLLERHSANSELRAMAHTLSCLLYTSPSPRDRG